MENAIRKNLSDEEFQLWKQFSVVLEGDYPEIWTDRPWHPDTKTEIYTLIWVTKQLRVELPILVFERIAFWIQLVELCKDFRAGKLLLQIRIVKIPFDTVPFKLIDSLVTRLTETQNIDFDQHQEFDSDLADLDKAKKLYPTWREITKTLAKVEWKCFFKRKDRYRIVVPRRAEWDEFLK